MNFEWLCHPGFPPLTTHALSPDHACPPCHARPPAWPCTPPDHATYFLATFFCRKQHQNERNETEICQWNLIYVNSKGSRWEALTVPVTPSVSTQTQPASSIPSALACSSTTAACSARQFNRMIRAPAGRTIIINKKLSCSSVEWSVPLQIE